MEAEERRRQIMNCLLQAKTPITGTELAKKLRVSRQVIVQDIALLRAAGSEIIATPQGYLVAKPPVITKLRKIFPCIHTHEGLEEELVAIVDCGGTVVDVMIEHPIYGDLRGTLNLRSRYDVQLFVERLESSNAQPLAILTHGVHLHTVEADSQEQLDAIEEKLFQAGILLK